MKNRLIASLLLTSMTLPSLARAQDKKPEPPKVEVKEDTGKISPLKQNQPAPYPGVLFSPKAAAVVAIEISTAKQKIVIEVESAVKTAEAKKDRAFNILKIQCDTDRKILSATSEERIKRIGQLESDLKNAQAAAPSRPFWTGVGVVGGIAVTLLTVFIVGQATK